MEYQLHIGGQSIFNIVAGLATVGRQLKRLGQLMWLGGLGRRAAWNILVTAATLANLVKPATLDIPPQPK